MKKIIIALIALATVITGCATGTLEDENLLQHVPLPGGPWKMSQAKNGILLTTGWVSTDGEEIVKTSVYRRTSNMSTVAFRKESDAHAGGKLCAEFNSEVLKSERENGYESLTWKTSCKTAKGDRSAHLFKAISGQDAFYHVHKGWWKDVTKEDWQVWSDYFGRILVCDSRSTAHPCPSGFKEVKK